MSVKEILKFLEEKSLSTAEKGRIFEKFCKAYLLTDPAYATQLERIWLWSDFPYRDSIDTGIDLVAKTKDGNYWAIQCKFYNEKYQVAKKDVDSFLASSGRIFFDETEQAHCYSRRILFSTTDRWSKNAEKTIERQDIPVTRIGVKQLEESDIDWSKFDIQNYERLSLSPKYELKDHQLEALEKAREYYKNADRGQLIMSCETGKTFTSLNIVLDLVGNNGTVLFLAPSISLVSQSLREWISQSPVSISPIVICSDNKASAVVDEDISTVDLIHPATTNPESVLEQYNKVKDKDGLKVFFSTYQSIEVIEEMQRNSGFVFDMIVCDEAHRTTGAKALGETGSCFLAVHNNARIPAKKRLYMTATPRIYSPAIKKRAKNEDAVVSSMDDFSIFGLEFYRLGFAESIKRGLLTDYKVIIISVEEEFVNSKFKNLLGNESSEVNIDDLTRIFGIWSGLSKRSKDPDEYLDDPGFMKKGVIYTNTIRDSKRIEKLFDYVTNEFDDKSSMANIQIKHIDGKMDALTRSNAIDWLKEKTDQQDCRILTNARCLSEGVDIPALDAIAFTSPKSSVIDIIQSVGRVMRKDPEGNKKYGYIIIPVAVSSSDDPEKVLEGNEYNIIWNVLRALRSHDERLSAVINRLSLNQLSGAKENFNQGEGPFIHFEPPELIEENSENGTVISSEVNSLKTDAWREAVFAKIVSEVQDSSYLKNWINDIVELSNKYVRSLKDILKQDNPKILNEFNRLHKSLQDNLNRSVTSDDSIEMIAQHLIIKPIFEILFEDNDFFRTNPVASAMEEVIQVLESTSFKTETENLKPFYNNIQDRIKGVTTLQGKQQILQELYEKFFILAFSKQSKKYGVYNTPDEAIDFILNSIEVLLQNEFNTSLGNEGVEIIDPFAGNGNFITRLLSSKLIPKNKLEYKYQSELNANEVILFAYYIACINIEETFRTELGSEEIKPFKGMVFTDTFQIYKGMKIQRDYNCFPENTERINKQIKKPVSIIIGNPPSRSKQRSRNDNNQNLKYPALDKAVSNTYSIESNTHFKISIYNNYIKAFRWATDRLKKTGGIIGFISDGEFVNNKAMDGFRKSLLDEFTDVFILTFRSSRLSGVKTRNREETEFNKTNRLTAITLLVKNPNKTPSRIVHYFHIDNCLTINKKLEVINEKNDISKIDWKVIAPDENNNWINQCNDEFENFILLGNKTNCEPSVFENRYSNGFIPTSNAWFINYSSVKLADNVNYLIDYYNCQRKDYHKNKINDISFSEYVDSDSTKIKWSPQMLNSGERNVAFSFYSRNILEVFQKPFNKQKMYYDREFCSGAYLQSCIFPNGYPNIAIIISGTGNRTEFTTLVVNNLPLFNFINLGQSFPLYWYEPNFAWLLDQTGIEKSMIKQDSISDWFLEKARKVYNDSKISKEDIFYYIYGILHSPEYKIKYANDLKRSLPRIPFVHDFWNFSKAGKKLAFLHLNYETIDPYPVEEIIKQLDDNLYRVKKMRFGKNNEKVDKSIIIFNDQIILKNIPIRAYNYKLCGRSAIEWIMKEYQVKIDKQSGLKNDPNDWCKECGNERYILDLIKRIINVSVQTVDIVNNLPKLEILKIQNI